MKYLRTYESHSNDKITNDEYIQIGEKLIDILNLEFENSPFEINDIECYNNTFSLYHYIGKDTYVYNFKIYTSSENDPIGYIESKINRFGKKYGINRYEVLPAGFTTDNSNFVFTLYTEVRNPKNILIYNT